MSACGHYQGVVLTLTNIMETAFETTGLAAQHAECTHCFHSYIVCTGKLIMAKSVICKACSTEGFVQLKLCFMLTLKLDWAELLLCFFSETVSTATMCCTAGCQAALHHHCLCRGIEQEERVGHQAACGCCHWGVHCPLHSPRAQVRLQAEECQLHQYQWPQVSVCIHRQNTVQCHATAQEGQINQHPVPEVSHATSSPYCNV